MFDAKNNPNVPNVEKQIKADRFVEEKSMKEDNDNYNKPTLDPLVNLQVYQNQQNSADKKQPGTYIPIPQLNNSFTPFQNYNSMYTYMPQMVPVVNNFKIETKGPLDNHARLSMIYEDILPSKQFMTTVNTLDERIHLYEFVRSVLIKDKDGDDLMVFSNNYNTLMNYIKFMDLNPYNTNIFSSNPYLGLPIDMLLYRSCYPIKYNRYNSSVMCAKNSIGINLRIYKLSDKELEVFYNKNNGTGTLITDILNDSTIATKITPLNIDDYELWREVAYYEYIRETIIKKKISPNFVIMYSFNVVLTPFIDYNKLEKMRGNQSKDSGKYKGKSLILITESPTHNLYGWASNTYQSQNNIKKMVYTGFYSEKIWFTIIFQLMAALYTMQKNNIIFHDFSVEDNVYIKDLNIDAANIKYWKYIIDKVEYFIPNYGYLLMIDSKYKDIMKPKLLTSSMHKVYGCIYNDFDETSVKNKCFDAFKNCFSNTFSQAFIKNGGVLPPDNVLKFIESINKQTHNNSNTDISYYIHLCMTKFMNNRIGTVLKTNESQYIRNDDKTKFTKGQIVAFEYSNKNYKFVAFNAYNNDSNDCLIFNKTTVDNSDICLSSCPLNKLSNYSAMEIVAQNYKNGEVNFNEDNLLETYIT